MQLRIKNILFILFILSSTLGFSQFDSTYIHTNHESFSIYPIFEFYKTKYNLRLDAEDENGDPLYEDVEKSFHTKNSFHLGFGVSFKRFGFAFTFLLPYSNIPELKASKVFAFSGGYSYRKFYGEAKLKHYKGLQEENITYHGDSLDINTSIRENVTTKQISLMLYYMTSNKFNFDANYKNYNVQKKSAISFVFSGGVNYYSIDGELDFIEQKNRNLANIKKTVDVYSIKTMPGVTGVLVFRNFYFTSFFLLGPAYNYNLLDKSEVRHNIFPSIEFRSALGYNSGNYFFSFTFNYDNDLIFLRENELGINNYMFNLKLGIKLNSKYLGKMGRYL